MKIGNDLVLYYLLFGIIFIQVLHKDSMKDQPEKPFSFLLLFLAFVNFGKVIPSLVVGFKLFFHVCNTFYFFISC